MIAKEAIAAIESRAFALRMTVAQVCAEAGIFTSVWSRAKHRGTIRPSLLARMEDVLDRLEREKAA